MSRAPVQTAINDFNALHDQPPKLVDKLVEHRAEPFYLAEVMDLVNPANACSTLGPTLETAAKTAGHADVFKAAKSAHDQVTQGKKAANETNTALLIQNILDFQFGTGAEAMIGELQHRGRLEKFANEVQRIEPQWLGQVGQIVGKAVVDGLVPATAVVAFNGQGWDANVLNDQQKEAGQTRTAAATDSAEKEAASDLGTKRKALEDAEKNLHALDNELAKQLVGDGLGSTLTDEKKVAYIKDYQSKDKYKNAVKAVADASAALGITLRRDGDDVAAFGADSNDPVQGGQAGKDLLDTYTALALAPGNSVLLAKLADKPPVALASHKDDLKKLAQQAFEADLPIEFKGLRETFEAAEKKEKGSGYSAVLEQAKKRLVEPYEAYTQFKDLVTVGQQIDKAVPAFKAYLQVRSGLSVADKHAQLTKVFQIFAAEEGGAATRVGKGLAALLGGATDLNEFGKSGELTALANAVLGNGREFLAAAKASKDGAELAGAAEGLSDVGFKLKLLPTMAIALGGIQLIDDGKNFAKSKNPADFTAAVGDLVSIIGGAIACLPPPVDAVGEAISVIGSAITYVSHLFRGDPEGDQRRKDEQTTLGDTNAYGADTPELKKVFTDPDAKHTLEMAAKEKPPWTPDQIHAVATKYPFLFTEAYTAEAANNVRKFYAKKENGGLSAKYTSSFYVFITTYPGDLKDLAEFAAGFSFAQIDNEWGEGANAVYAQLQRSYQKADWSNDTPAFTQRMGL